MTNVHQLRPAKSKGFWAEFIAFHEADGQPVRAFQFGGTAASTSLRAVAWIRLRMRRAAVQMTAESAVKDVCNWLNDRNTAADALTSLIDGEMYVHIVTEDGGREGRLHYEVTVRPIHLPRRAYRRPYVVVPLHKGRSA